MCLIAFALGTHADRPLLLASNRDEFFERPTQPLDHWRLPDGTAVAGGRDLREGGTWLAMSEAGRVAMLTNVRSAQVGPGLRSRGELPTQWLKSDTTWEQLLLDCRPSDYGGFNLVVGDLRNGFWAWLSNRHPQRPHLAQPSPSWHHRPLAAGVYGLSNASLDTPWPKTQKLKKALSEALNMAAPETDIAQACSTLSAPEQDPLLAAPLAALADSQTEDAANLPATGVPAEVERALSSPFVDLSTSGYGTRSSLVINVSRQKSHWQAHLCEWTHPPPAQGPHRWRSGTARCLNLTLGSVAG